MLVYEYIDNGNLEQWLHGDVGPVSPLTWDIRMTIAVGTAKGCDNFVFCLFILPVLIVKNEASNDFLSCLNMLVT